MKQKLDTNVDGLPYEEEQIEPKPGGSILHEDIRRLKENLTGVTNLLSEFSIDVPEIAWAEVQVDISSDKKIKVGSSRRVLDGETITEAHERLYKNCLESLTKLVG